MSDWLQSACQRLSQDGFKIDNNMLLDGQTLPAFAHRSGFSLAKFGNYEQFFVFQTIPGPLTLQALQQFSAAAFRLAKERRAVRLPPGLFEAIGVYPIILTDKLDPSLAQAIAHQAPSKHFAAFEFPAVYDRATNQLHYYQDTPLWGAAYYRGFRSTVQKYLAPATAAQAPPPREVGRRRIA